MKKFFVLAGALLAIGAVGCSKSQTPENASEESTAAAPTAAENTAVEACAMTTDAKIDQIAWVDANNAFSLAMLASMKDSAVVSSFSVERALGMIMDGACGQTASEMRTALKMPEAANLSEMGRDIEKTMLENLSAAVELSIDNHIWVDQSAKLMPNYVDKMKANYNAEPTLVDFAHDADGARTTINDSVAKSTRDRIQDILPPNSVNSLTRLVLTNAVYFKAPWKAAFKVENTKKEDFTTAAGVKQVDMMHHKEKHAYVERDNYIAFDMDFNESDYAFMVILPKLDEGADVMQALSTVENSLTAQAFRTAREEMFVRKVELAMPKYRVEAGAALSDLLQSLGMVRAFGDADFSAITGDRSLVVSQVFHKAFIEVSEEGAEAAAATAGVMMMRALPPRVEETKITVDHPFIYAIVEKTSGTALFMGRVTDF